MKSSFQILSEKNEARLEELILVEVGLRSKLVQCDKELRQLEDQLENFSRSIQPGLGLQIETMRSFLAKIDFEQKRITQEKTTLFQHLQGNLQAQSEVRKTQAKYTVILDRHDSTLRLKEAKQAQKQNDEFASRAWLRASLPS